MALKLDLGLDRELDLELIPPWQAAKTRKPEDIYRPDTSEKTSNEFGPPQPAAIGLPVSRTGTSASSNSARSGRPAVGLQANPKDWTITTDTWKTSQAPPIRGRSQLPPLAVPPIPVHSTRPSAERRPMTASTKRLSWGSDASSKRPIKYGTGKFARVELVPQPSDDPDDPLKWPRWKKDLNLAALLFAVALIGVMKTAFVSVNSVLTLNYAVSYTAAAALTGVPLVVSAFTGLVSLSLARIWGKRPVYLAAWACVVFGVVLNAAAISSYGQCMAARVFQGAGWGAFDVLVLGSIYDTFYEHQRDLRLALYSVIAVGTTWGPPLIGGVVSQGPRSFALQFEVIAIFCIPATALIALGAPESVFDRAFSALPTPSTANTAYQKSLPLRPRNALSRESVKAYLATMKVHVYRGILHAHALLQAPRAMIAPTSVLLFVVSFLPLASLWGLTSTLSLYFSSLPFLLDPASIGLLLTGPWLLALVATAAFALSAVWTRRFLRLYNAIALAVGSVFAFIGLLTFGLYLDAAMTPSSGSGSGSNSVFALNYLGNGVSLSTVSFLLGLLAVGVYVLDAATVRPSIRHSVQFTSSNLGVALRCTVDMEGGVTVLRTLLSGIFVMAMPNAIWWWDGLKNACVGIAVVQLLLGFAVAAGWWAFDEHVRRLDGRVLGCADLSLLKQNASFFDSSD